MRTQGTWRYQRALALITGLALAAGVVYSGVLIGPSPALGQSGPGPGIGDLALVAGAPTWANFASGPVWFQFTQRAQRLRASLQARTLPPGALPIEAVIAIRATMFNKDPNSLPQNETTVVTDPNNSSRVVGGYNDYRGLLAPGNFSGWSTSTDGGATVARDGQIPALAILSESIPSGGDPVVDTDVSGNMFFTSLHFNSSQTKSAITIWRSPAAGGSTGVFGSACSGGTDPDCWPAKRAVRADTCTSSGGFFHDKNYHAVDRVSTSPAKGRVYVVWTRFNCADFTSAIVISKCTNSLSSCTTPTALESTPGTGSALDFVQLSHIAIGPNGKVYVTWNKHGGAGYATQTNAIRFRVIAPTSSDTSIGTLGPLRTVFTEAMPIPWGRKPYPTNFRISTYPHIFVQGTMALIVWDARTVSNILFNYFWFDSQIRGATTTNDGASFSAPFTINNAAGPQYQPDVCYDPVSARWVVAYYSQQNDTLFRHWQDVYVATASAPGGPYSPLRVTSPANDAESDPYLGDYFSGDYIEVACSAGLVYAHYTANYTLKNTAIWSGGASSVFVRQQDNFLARVTVP